MVKTATAPPTRFGYAGVVFEMSGPATGWDLAKEHLDFADRTPDEGVLARVECAFDLVKEDGADLDRTVRWRWTGDEAEVGTARVDATVRRRSRGLYDARGEVAGGSHVSSLVTAVASAIASREGALVLHAAGVQVGGRAVLFVGPSGAGKTTSANHCPGTRWMARDRAAVVPVGGSWFAWGMAGGDPIDLPREPHRSLPLGAVLRVHRTDGPSRIEALEGARAVTVLRESVQSGGVGIEEERRQLDAILRAAGEARVGIVHARLGEPLTELVDAFVRGAQ